MIWLRNLLRIGSGVCASGLTSGLIASIALSLEDSLSLFQFIRTWLGIAAFLIILASPALLIAIIWSEWKAIRRWWYFMLWGLLVPVIWLLIFADREILTEIMEAPYITIFTLLCGLTGGLAYWLAAGRRAGNWKLHQTG